MDIYIKLFEVLFPVFFVVGIGFYLGKKMLGIDEVDLSEYSKNIETILPEGETEETTTHDTLGAEKISFEKVFNKSIYLLTN